jgi:RNA polymerase sigma-70 factor (ECF subfamily)
VSAATATSDDAIVSQLVRGDATALDDVLRLHLPAVYGYVRSRILEASDAERITQRAFENLYSHRAKFRSDAELRPWLMETARDLVLEHLRADRTHKHAWAELCLDHGESPDVANDDFASRLRGCLDGLAPSAREALELMYRGNRSLSGVGERLRRSDEAVKLLLFRSRQILRRCLERGPESSVESH